MKQGKTLASFKIDSNLWDAFKQKATDQGSNATAEIVNFINKYLSETDESPAVTLPLLNLEEQIKSQLDGYLDKCLEICVKEKLESLLTESTINEGLKKILPGYLDRRVEEVLDSIVDNKFSSGSLNDRILDVIEDFLTKEGDLDC